MKLLVVLLSFFLNQLTFGCCDMSEIKLIGQAKIIFAGKALESELIDDSLVKTTFEVIENFKGSPNQYEIVYSPISSSSCDVNYIVGLTHVVMLDEKNNLSSCCSYDEYYSESLSNRADITFRNILKELRKELKSDSL